MMKNKTSFFAGLLVLVSFIFLLMISAQVDRAAAQSVGRVDLQASAEPTQLAPTATATLATQEAATEPSRPRRPTRTPRPTSTPLTIPPPTDPELLNWMIVFAFFAVVVVVAGIWTNRER